jgi:hypothetical protein
LKKCPNCGSISNDEKPACGVCGRSLAGTASLSLEQAVRIQGPDFQPARPSIKNSIYALLAGISLILVGTVGLFLNLLVLFVLLLPGLFIIMMSVASAGKSRPPREWGGPEGGNTSGGEGSIRREAVREKAKEQERKSGGTD